MLNNLNRYWTFGAVICILVNLILIIKNLGLIIAYIGVKSKNSSASFRPESYETLFGIKLDRGCAETIEKILREDDGQIRDENGNTELHASVRDGKSPSEIEDQAKDKPHLLFVLNNRGQTPLDLAMEEEVQTMDNIEQQNDKENDTEMSERQKPSKEVQFRPEKHKTGKIFDES